MTVFNCRNPSPGCAGQLAGLPKPVEFMGPGSRVWDTGNKKGFYNPLTILYISDVCIYIYLYTCIHLYISTHIKYILNIYYTYIIHIFYIYYIILYYII